MPLAFIGWGRFVCGVVSGLFLSMAIISLEDLATALALPSDSADLLLLATAAQRTLERYLGFPLDYEERLELTSPRADYIFLERGCVHEVVSIKLYDSEIDANTYELTSPEAGTLVATQRPFPSSHWYSRGIEPAPLYPRQILKVHYRSGFDLDSHPAPDDIKLALIETARGIQTLRKVDPSVSSISLGGNSISYRDSARALSPIAKDLLSRYRSGRGLMA